MLKDKEELNLAKSFILGGITRKKLFFLCEKNETIIINPRIVEKKNVDIESIYEYEEYGLLNKTPSKKQNKLFKLLKKDQKIIYFLDEQILNKEFMGAEFLKRGNNCYYCTKRIETLNNISQTLNDWYNKEYYKLKKKFGLTIKGLRMPWEKNNIFKVYINFNDAEIKHVSFNLNEYFIINVLGNENDKIRKEIWFNINCLSLADSLTTSREIYIENKEDLYKLINDVFIQTKNTKSKYVFRGISHDIEMLPSLYRRGIDIINDKLDIFKLQKNEEKLKKILNYLHIEYKNDMSVKEIEIELLRGICNKIEKESLRKFEQNCALYFTNIDTEYDFISNAQHYGISTRLLDWTFNIYAALLFAIFSNETPDGGYYKVLALDIHEHIYCDKILNIPNGRNLSFNYEKILDFFNSVSTIYNETSYVSKKQIETIFSSSIHESVLKEKYSSIDNKNFKDEDLKLKYIDRLYDKFSEDKFFFVVPPFSNQRIASQQGVLQVILTYDYKKMFAMMKKFSFKININKDLRSELIEQIEKIGHNMFKIMPDLSNNCSTIMKKTMDKINSQILNDIKVECKLSDKKTSVLFLYPIYYDVAHYKSAKRKEIPPFGVMYLASAVKKMGLNVEIRGIDSSYNDIYDFRKYDIVAYSIPSSITYPIMKKVNDIAMYSPKALKIVGGLHPTIYPDSVFKDMHPDVLLMGEGEESIVKVINHYMDRDFSDIEGVYVKNKNITPFKISNLDSIAFPARELMDKEDILIERLYSMNDNRLLKIIHILCSRGCNFRCNFCGNQMRPIRYRSGNNVAQEIELLCEEYPDMEGFCIIDDNFLMENSNVVDIIYQILLLNNYEYLEGVSRFRI